MFTNLIILLTIYAIYTLMNDDVNIATIINKIYTPITLPLRNIFNVDVMRDADGTADDDDTTYADDAIAADYIERQQRRIDTNEQKSIDNIYTPLEISFINKNVPLI
jgi:hypothetical protein